MAESFFTDGEAYEQFMGRWSRAAGEQFIDWLAVPVGQKWLDVGCGTGAFTELVLARCKPSTIDAIDPAEDQIAFARRRPGAAQASFRACRISPRAFSDVRSVSEGRSVCPVCRMLPRGLLSPSPRDSSCIRRWRIWNTSNRGKRGT